MHDRAAVFPVRGKKGFAPLWSPVVHLDRFSLDPTDRRIDISMIGTTSAPRRLTGFPA
jgi:hypothetical protein